MLVMDLLNLVVASIFLSDYFKVQFSGIDEFEIESTMLLIKERAGGGV